MESLPQVLIGVGTLLTPLVIAAFARDRALLSMVNAQTADVNARINRVRDEFVRRDDLAEHLSRFDKQLDDMRDDWRRLSDRIEALIAERPHVGPRRIAPS